MTDLYAWQCKFLYSPPWADPGDSGFLSKSPSLSALLSLIPLLSHLMDGDFFILNARTAHGPKHHYHNPLGGMSGICQNSMGCMWGLYRDAVVSTVKDVFECF